MNYRLLLLDWDDVVMDREKVAERQQKRAIELLGKERAEQLWNSYAKMREDCDGRIDVDTFIAGFDQEVQGKIHDVFYGIDFPQCVDKEAWRSLVMAADKAGYCIKIFSEGSSRYQRHKMEASRLGIDEGMLNLGETEVFKDKLKAFSSELRSEVSDLGYTEIIYVDDRGDYLDKVYQICEKRIRCIWMDNGKETQIRPTNEFEVITNLRELGGLIDGQQRTVEGQVLEPLSHA